MPRRSNSRKHTKAEEHRSREPKNKVGVVPIFDTGCVQQPRHWVRAAGWLIFCRIFFVCWWWHYSCCLNVLPQLRWSWCVGSTQPSGIHLDMEQRSGSRKHTRAGTPERSSGGSRLRYRGVHLAGVRTNVMLGACGCAAVLLHVVMMAAMFFFKANKRHALFCERRTYSSKNLERRLYCFGEVNLINSFSLVQ